MTTPAPRREDDSPDALARALGHRFRRPALLREALTHASAAGAARGPTLERLEFLGDRVLGLVIAHLLYERFPGEPEGALARRLAQLVRRETLAGVARGIGLGRHLVLSRSEEDAGGRDNPAILADACEAVIAALYLDGGLEAAARFIESHWDAPMRAEARPPQDAKTALQEWAQGRGKPLPQYRTVAAEGPAHEPVFRVEVRVEGMPPVTAEGPSKRAAEQAAAAEMLARAGHGRGG